MFDFKKYFSTKATKQSQPIPGTNQVPNSAGGYAWQLDDWARLDRFLVLGCEGGTYYVGERELTIENATNVARCITADGTRTVARIVAISEAGRAPKNVSTSFALRRSSCSRSPGRRAGLASAPSIAAVSAAPTAASVGAGVVEPTGVAVVGVSARLQPANARAALRLAIIANA